MIKPRAAGYNRRRAPQSRDRCSWPGHRADVI